MHGVRFCFAASALAWVSAGLRGGETALRNAGVDACVGSMMELTMIVYDDMVNGKYSDYAQLVQGYMADGHSEEEAYKLAAKDMAWRVGTAGVSSAAANLAVLTSEKAYDVFENYERNCEAAGRPLSLPEAIAADSVKDSFTVKPNKLKKQLESNICKKLLGDTKTPLLTDGGSAALVPVDGETPIQLGDGRGGRRIVWNNHNSLDVDMETDYNGDTKPEKPTAGI